MNKLIKSSILLTAIALGTSAFASSFTPGNLVIYRVGGDASGNTAGALTNRGNFVWLDEYTTDGVTRVQSIMMPTNYFGANSPLIGVGSTYGNGLITRSGDGRFIVITGYGATTNQTGASLQTPAGTTVPRVIGLVDGNGHIDTTTVQTNNYVDGEDVRSAATPDGTNIWYSGSSSGVRFTQRIIGSPGVATQLLVPNAGFVGNIRQLNIFNSQLYFTSATLGTTNLFSITNNTPGQLPTVTNDILQAGLPGLTNNVPFYTSPYAFVFFKLQAGGSDPLDTVYVADAGTNSASGSIRKFCLNAGNWSNSGSIKCSTAVGLTGQTRITGSTTNVDLWIITDADAASGNNSLQNATDPTGYNGAASGSANANILVTSASSVAWRGVAFAPVGGETFPTGPANLSVGPLLDYLSTANTGCSATETDKYSIANLGASTMTWAANDPSNWVSFLPASSGSLPAGGSITISAYFNGSVTSLPAGTNLTTITFTNTTVGSVLGTQTRRVQLVMKDQNIFPSTDLSPFGSVGGPFSPATNTITVYNGSTPIHLVVATNSAGSTSWLSISPSDIPSLGACVSTNITISVNSSVATNYTAGNYIANIIFSNATAGTVIDTVNDTLSIGGTYFCDDFSTYVQNAILAGQQGWTAVGGILNEPYVTNNAVYVTTTTTQEAADEPFKNLPQIAATNRPNDSVFCAMVMTVTSAAPVITASPSRIWTFWQGQNASGYARDQLTVRDTGSGTFVFAIRINGITANAYRFGTTPLNYNTPYRVIVQGRVDNTNTYVYVEPSSPTLNTSSAYCSTNVVGSNAADFNIGSVQFGNAFNSASFNYQAGIAISKMCVTTNYTEAYNDITSSTIAPVASFGATTPTAGVAPLSVTFVNTSSGTAPITSYWTFGDGASVTNTGANVSHTYAAGTYTVSLLASNSAGTSTATSNNLVTVITAQQAWSNYYGVAANATDTDGDGVVNSNEFLAGFNPNNAGAYAHVISIVKSGSDVNITYMGSSGDTNYAGGPSFRTNVLEYTGGSAGNYSNNFGTTIQTLILSNGNGLGFITNGVDVGGAAVTSRYYRVKVLTP